MRDVLAWVLFLVPAWFLMDYAVIVAWVVGAGCVLCLAGWVGVRLWLRGADADRATARHADAWFVDEAGHIVNRTGERV